MSVRLFDYNYVVQYLPGVKNTVADFLSRMPLPSKNTDEDGKEDMWVAIVDECIYRGITQDEWNTEQDLDEAMKELGVMITKGWPLKKMVNNNLYPSGKRYVVYAENGCHHSRMPRARDAARFCYVYIEAFKKGNSRETVVEADGTTARLPCTILCL
ncbi:hypothetical protein NDU88_006511 [Pleurodeles waltl]|uniref:Uncharacterized protein n=1 Tax=Pleurodeles waltl TaxID=8319 RepID=A0AAV7PLN3_PLEWA|nr:hypothetical protein NDU88_006511 [Pleurodeles waltl]